MTKMLSGIGLAFFGGSAIKRVFTIVNHFAIGAPALMYVTHALFLMNVPFPTAWIAALLLGDVAVGGAIITFLLSSLHLVTLPFFNLSGLQIPSLQDLMNLIHSFTSPALPHS